MDKNKTKHKNMFLKESLHFLDNELKKAFLMSESRLVYMTPGKNPEAGGQAPSWFEGQESGKDIPKANQEAIKKLQEELANLNKYNEGFDKFVAEKEIERTYTKQLNENDCVEIGQDMILDLAKRLDPKIKDLKDFRKFAHATSQNISEAVLKNSGLEISNAIKKHAGTINENIPVTIKLGPGSSLEFYNKAKNFSIKLDLKTDSPQAKFIQSQIDELSRAREKKDEKKGEVIDKTKGGLKETKQGVKPQENFELLANESKSQYLKKQGDIYVVDFKNGKAVDRKAEKETQIQDLLDLSKLKGGNMYIRIYVDGTSPEGVPHKYWAYYHPSQETFIKEGTKERAKIFHGTKISKIEYKVATPKQAKMPKTAPGEKPEAPKMSQEAREKARKARVERRNWKNIQDNHNYVFDNAKFGVPEFIQDDPDFKKNWGRINAILDEALTGAPFNITTPEARRKYIQDVIQGTGLSAAFDLNSNLYAEDFFKHKINGKELYKGGYKKWKKDWSETHKQIKDLKMDYKNPKNEKEIKIAEKWANLESIGFGLGRIFAALGRTDLLHKSPETSDDKYKTTLVGIGNLSAAEKEKLGTLEYHNLNSLLHRRENAPKGIDIGVSSDIVTEIKGMIIDQEVPGLNTGELVAEKGGLKVMFMAFGLENLIKQGCIKKLDDKHYVLVQVPKNGWAEALGVLSKNKAKLYDHSADNLKKWEAVRASLDKGMQARNFILKIFKPTNSEIKQNINWWQKMWHWSGGKKEVNMEYLGNVTLNPSDLEKHVAKDRGYLDMMEKTSKRIEGTSIYEPQNDEVLKLTNNYLEMSLLATFMNASPKNLGKITDQLLNDFNIADKVKLLRPLEKKENRLENVKKIYEAIALKNLDPSTLTKAHIRMIQLGYVAQRQMETSLEQENTLSGNLSTQPLYREIQKQALRDGCPVYKLKEIEQRIHLAIFGLSQSMHAPGVSEFNVRGAGAAASIDLGEWGGQKWHFSAGAAGVDGKFMPFAEVGAAIKLGKKVNLKWSLGTTIGFSGASVGVEFPITSEWDMYVNAGAGVDWKGKVGVGGAIGAKWNQMRANKIKENSALTERGANEIDKMIDGNPSKAVELILKNPTFGEYVKAIKDKFKLPDAVVLDIYRNAKTEWLNEARRGVKIPAVTGFGAGFFTGVSAANPMESGVSVGAYITFKVPGTTVNYVVRQEHPQYSEYVQSKVAAEDLRKQLEKAESGGKNVISEFTLSAKSGIVYFDSRLGRGHVAKPNSTTEAQKTMAIKDSEREAELSVGSTFEAIKRTFAGVDMHVEMVKDPKNPKNTILAVTPLQTEGSNVEMLIDPELKSKGIIFDSQNNRILLAASEASKLHITRTRYRYPFNRKGAMNLDVIAFKDNPDRSNAEIKEDSPQYIYKYQGEKYAMVRGEARTGLAEADANTMTLGQYKERKATYESFNDKKLEYSLREGRNLTNGMSEAIGYKDQESVRFDELRLADFADASLKRNRAMFEAGVGSADTPEKEAAFKTNVFQNLKNQFKKYAKETLGNDKLSLNEQELNLIYTYMLNETFVKLASSSDEVVTRRLETRNKLFRNYMKKYVSDFADRYPDKWAEIRKIDPSITPDSIADYLMLTMPQNARQFKEFLQKEQLPIGEGLKFASYTLKGKNEAFATSYGMQMPEKFQDILKMVGPTKLNIDSPIPQEKAAARLILQVMSPLDTRNLESADGKKKFLESELSLLLISMYDEASGVSPMIEVLGKKNYEGMTKIYEAIKSKSGKNLDEALKTNEQAFNAFKELVTGVRNAQLSGEPTFVFKNKYIFHMDKTEVYSGPYLRCGNGTIAARQQIGISIKQGNVGEWYGAKTGVNIAGIPNERLGYKTFTLGWAHTFKSKPETGKDNPPSDDEPGKGRPASDTEKTTGGTEGSTTKPSVETPVSDRPSNDL